MSRDDGYLLDILDSARLALGYVAEISKDEFLHDLECQDAVIRRIGIIGEARGGSHQPVAPSSRRSRGAPSSG